MDWFLLVTILLVVLVTLIMIAWCRACCVREKTGGRDRREGDLRVKDLSQHPRSKSEALVVRYLEELTGDKFPTVYPDWLVWRGSTLELDGFNGKIALEFSGPLHTKWSPSKESYESYFSRVVKDVVKLRTCAARGIPLIVVDASLPSRHWRAYVVSRLYDLGVIPDRPPDYIGEQVAEVYRNPQIERELGLEPDYIEATKIGE
jgi:hypothetical protein